MWIAQGTETRKISAHSAQILALFLGYFPSVVSLSSRM